MNDLTFLQLPTCCPRRTWQWNGEWENACAQSIQIHHYEWTEWKRDGDRARGGRERDAISIVRETEIEAEIIPSSRRDSLVSLVCVSFLQLYVTGPTTVRVRHGYDAVHSRRVPPSPATCWSIVINCCHDIPIVELFVAFTATEEIAFP